MAQTLQITLSALPVWLEIIESDDGQYRVMDMSFDDGAMELACFQNADRAVQFATRLAERRSGLLQQR
jgi:hypothetical protein